MFRIYRYEEDPVKDSEQTDVPQSDDAELDSELDFDTDFESSDLETDTVNDGEDSELDLNSDSPDEEDTGEDPNFQGIIRTVTGACLVYKRKTPQNNYEELWVYNVGGRDIKPELQIRTSILAGTDIDPKTQRSPDGQQTCRTITAGNVQFLELTGLIN